MYTYKIYIYIQNTYTSIYTTYLYTIYTVHTVHNICLEARKKAPGPPSTTAFMELGAFSKRSVSVSAWKKAEDLRSRATTGASGDMPGLLRIHVNSYYS